MPTGKTRGDCPMCTRNALQQVVEVFAGQDPQLMAERSGARFQGNCFFLDYCGLPLEIGYPTGAMKILRKKDRPNEPEITNDEKIVTLQYLTYASGLPLRGEELSFLKLRGGQLHWHPFQSEALKPLAQRYGSNTAEFLSRGQRYGGKPVEHGDAALVIPVYPRLPLTYILWEGEEEFEPRAVVLFDAVSETYLSTATLYVMAIQVMIRIWFPGDSRFNDK